LPSIESIPIKETVTPPRVSERKLALSIGKSTFFGVVARFAQIGTRIVTVPIVIAHLGLGGYGIWSIIMTTSAYMRFGSVGIKSAFQKYVADASGNGDFETANKLLSTGCAIMLVLSVVGLIPSAIFSRKLASAAGVPPEFLGAAASSITILAIIMLLSNVGAVYEAIVMGGHRIDLVRKYATLFTVLEAAAIVIVLHFGYGLFAMATIMALSEVCYLGCCYISSKSVMPNIKLGYQYVSRGCLRELTRYAGSYQLVNLLEVLYAAILPVTILREFGAAASGIYAIALRLAGSAAMLPEAFLHPILSGGSMVYASGHVEGMRRLISKSYKMTLALSLFPLAFLSAFGMPLVYAWTGQVDTSFRKALILVSMTMLFGSFSMLGLVLYRVSGRALLDNVRQVLRILTLLIIAFMARKIGFYGVLGGWATAELIGMLFMVYALTRTFSTFRMRDLLPDTLRLLVAIAIVLSVGALCAYLPLPHFHNSRVTALFQVGVVGLGCLVVAWPVLLLTKGVTAPESRAILGALTPKFLRPRLAAAEHEPVE
jgi:O-antigen/teichoic acid export membrane protein